MLKPLVEEQLTRLGTDALAISSPDIRIPTLAALGDTIWKKDELYSRQLFTRAVECLRSFAATSSDDKRQFGLLQADLLTRISKHDRPWGQRLVAELKAESLGANLDLNVANMMLNEKDPGAAEFLNKGIASGIDGFSKSMRILDLLLRMRSVNKGMADSAFLNAVDQIGQLSKTKADDLFTIGNYLFTTPRIISADVDSNRVLLTPVYVGTISFHADISLDRPEVEPALVAGYLDRATAILAIPSEDPNVSAQNRAAAFLLIPKAQRFAPKLIPVLTTLASGVDATRTNSTSAATAAGLPGPTSEPITIDSVLARVEETKDPVKRDEYCLAMVAQFHGKNDFTAARTLTEKLGPAPLREQLTQLIDFREVVAKYQSGDLDNARNKTWSLPLTASRVSLSLGIVDAYLKKGDKNSANLTFDSAVKDIQKLNGTSQASLYLAASEVASRLDPLVAQSIFNDAMRSVSNLDTASRDPLRLDTFVRLTVGSRTVQFMTGVKGAPTGSLAGALKPAFSRDPQATLNATLQLKNDYLKGSAIVILANLAVN